MLFDIHGDIWTDVAIKRADGTRNVVRDYHLDRFSEGEMVGGVFMAWVDPPHDTDPKKRLLEIIKAASAEILENKDILTVIRNRREFDTAVAEKKLAVILGIEGLSGIEHDLDLLYPLRLMGLGLCSLTWNEENALATGVRGTAERGVTALGREAIALIEELGIILDTSHLNEKSFWDVMDAAKGPVIASHSNARAICDVSRNLTDDQIKAIGASGGLVGLNAFNEFVHKDPYKRTSDTLIAHMEHIANLIGIDKIALGFDFFEYISADSANTFIQEAYKGTKGLEDIRSGPAFVRQLREKGFSQDEIEGVAYKNFITLFDKLAQ